MDPVLNPFKPGSGRRPPVLAGREPLLRAFGVVQRRASELGEGDRAWVVNGLRGVGKTALLNELMRQAGGQSWIVAKVEATAGADLPAALSAALVRAMRTATGRHPEPRMRRLLGVFKAFTLRFDPSGAVSLGADIAPLTGVADTGRFADDLASLFEVMGETSRELGIGTLVLIDELQEATASEMTAVNTAVHHLGQGDDPLPVFFVGAGLPSLPAQLADATSYAERLYDYRHIGLLEPDSAAAALTEPVRRHEVSWSDEALDAALDFAAGYPYFLQAVGKHVWDVAVRSPISADDVAVGGGMARREVEEGLYRSRWERATPAQRQLMRVLGDIGGDGPSAISEVADRMEKRVSDLSVSRRDLIRKGLVYAPDRGVLAFTVPGMHAFVANQE